LSNPPETASGRDRLRAIIQDRSLKRGLFTLASGARSRVYLNLKTTMMHPEGARLAAEALIQALAPLEFEYVSGLEMGAVPLLGTVAALSAGTERPIHATFVRKAAKEHGTRVLVEGLDDHGGESVAGKKVAIIEDVATSGGSILKAVDQVRRAGGIVTDAVVVVDREQGGGAMLAEQGIRLHALFTATDLGVTDADRAPIED
jgi:orotate phosphoribosyltransferase